MGPQGCIYKCNLTLGIYIHFCLQGSLDRRSKGVIHGNPLPHSAAPQDTPRCRRCCYPLLTDVKPHTPGYGYTAKDSAAEKEPSQLWTAKVARR